MFRTPQLAALTIDCPPMRKGVEVGSADVVASITILSALTEIGGLETCPSSPAAYVDFSTTAPPFGAFSMVSSPTTSGVRDVITTGLNDQGDLVPHEEHLGLFDGSCGSTFKFGASALLLLLSSSLPLAARGGLEALGELRYGGMV